MAKRRIQESDLRTYGLIETIESVIAESSSAMTVLFLRQPYTNSKNNLKKLRTICGVTGVGWVSRRRNPTKLKRLYKINLLKNRCWVTALEPNPTHLRT